MITTEPVRTPGAQPPTPAVPRPTRGARRREKLAAFGSLLALLAMLLGLPALLATLVGWPLPSRVPTGPELLDAVRSPITDQMLVNVLACVFWIAWLQIVVCTVIELRAGLKGVGVPAKVPLAGVTQHLTRKLVASVLLLVTTAAILTPMTAAVTRAVLPDGPAQGSVSAAATVDSAPVTAVAAAPAAEAAAAVLAERGAAGTEDATRPAGELVGRKVLVVEPPDGRHHMSLWEIAETHLGDGLRYKEIFALNEGRTQPGGGELAKAKLIQPGWQLLMPDDAVGVDVVPEAPVEDPARAPAPTGVPGDGAGAAEGAGASEGGAGAVGSAQSGGGAGAGTTTQAVETSDQAADPLADESVLVSVLALAEAGLLSAGLLAGLAQLRKVQQRRRREGERLPLLPEELLRAEVAARLGQDPEAVRALDHALRMLSDRQAASFQPLPDVVAAVLDASVLRLVLAQPVRPVPAPFTAVDPLGASWQTSLGELPTDRPGALAPYPALVTVGNDDQGGQLLVDLEAVGVLSLSGPRRGTTAMLRAMAVELATSGWADHLRLTLVGFGEELVALQPERVRHVETLERALPALESRLASLSAHVDGPAGVLRSRASGGDPLMPELVLVAEQDRPDASVLARLQVVAAGLERRCGLALVTGEDVPSATWTVRLSADGSSLVQPLSVTLSSRGLDDEAWEAVTALVALAATAPAAPEPGVTEAGPSEADIAGANIAGAGVAGAGTSRPTPPASPPAVRLPSLADVTSRALAGAAPPAGLLRLVDDQHDEEPIGSAGEVRILGLVAVDVVGAAAAPHPHCIELVVLLALHPAGLTLPELAASLQPRDDADDAVRSVQVLVARARSWLGTDSAGRELLPHAEAGAPLRLSPEITLDWSRFQALTARGSAVEALALVTGPVLSGLPPRRYSWLVPTGLEQDVPSTVVDTATSAARRLLTANDPAGAASAAQAGLRADMLDERLWRELLRAEAAQGHLDRVSELSDHLEVLVDRELSPYDQLQPETLALLAELLPRGPERLARSV